MNNDLISRSELANFAYHATDNMGVKRCVVDWEDIEDAPSVDAVEFTEAETYIVLFVLNQIIKEMEEQGRDTACPRKYETLLGAKRKLKAQAEIWRNKDG